MTIKINNTQLENIFVTADHHFGHENIIGFCNRPFQTVYEMDMTLIENWNKIVKPTDTVIHLGDFTLGNWKVAEGYFKRLNGNIKVLGNSWHHDKRWLSKDYYGPIQLEYLDTKVNVEIIPPMVVLEIPEMGASEYPLAITLCHYPLAEWDRKHHGAWHLHGHSHAKYNPDRGEFILDVGVDNMNYYPISLGNVLGIMYEMGYV